MKNLFLSLLTFLLLLFLSLEACADSSNLYRNAGTVEPIDNENVRMVKEIVTIRAYAGESLAHCTFIFKNDSDTPHDVLMGFLQLCLSIRM